MIIKEQGVTTASAGLLEDWAETRGKILVKGKPVLPGASYTYLASTWATPQLRINKGERIDCFVMQSETEWDQHTFWPSEALAIINDENFRKSYLALR